MRDSAARGVAFVLAVALTGVASEPLSFSPLGSAAAATLTLGGVFWLSGILLPFADDQPLRANWRLLLLEALVVLVGLLVVAAALPAAQGFVCEPLVPHTLAIAIFGAFSLSWLSKASMIRSPNSERSFSILLAFFWIAPFYGFFNGPWAIAQAIAMRCAERSIPAELVAGAAMTAAAITGRATAKWMFAA